MKRGRENKGGKRKKKRREERREGRREEGREGTNIDDTQEPDGGRRELIRRKCALISTYTCCSCTHIHTIHKQIHNKWMENNLKVNIVLVNGLYKHKPEVGFCLCSLCRFELTISKWADHHLISFQNIKGKYISNLSIVLCPYIFCSLLKPNVLNRTIILFLKWLHLIFPGPIGWLSRKKHLQASMTV